MFQELSDHMWLVAVELDSVVLEHSHHPQRVLLLGAVLRNSNEPRQGRQAPAYTHDEGTDPGGLQERTPLWEILVTKMTGIADGGSHGD